MEAPIADSLVAPDGDRGDCRMPESHGAASGASCPIVSCRRRQAGQAAARALIELGRPRLHRPVSRKMSVKMGGVGGISLARKARLASWVFMEVRPDGSSSSMLTHSGLVATTAPQSAHCNAIAAAQRTEHQSAYSHTARLQAATASYPPTSRVCRDS